jgi:small subunit ribosomal protein S20
MANTKSAKKQAKKNIFKRSKNLARRTALKTSVKKVMTALESNSVEQAKQYLREAEAKLARAENKGIMHKNTVQRKISRLAKKVAQLSKSAKK